MTKHVPLPLFLGMHVVQVAASVPISSSISASQPLQSSLVNATKSSGTTSSGVSTLNMSTTYTTDTYSVSSTYSMPPYVNITNATSDTTLSTMGTAIASSLSLPSALSDIDSLIKGLFPSSTGSKYTNATTTTITAITSTSIPSNTTTFKTPFANATGLLPSSTYSTTTSSPSSSTPFPSTPTITPITTTNNEHTPALTSAQLAGTITGSVAGASIIILILLYLYQRRRKAKIASQEAQLFKVPGGHGSGSVYQRRGSANSSNNSRRRLESAWLYDPPVPTSPLTFTPPPPKLVPPTLALAKSRTRGQSRHTAPTTGSGRRRGRFPVSTRPSVDTRTVYSEVGNPFADEQPAVSPAHHTAQQGHQNEIVSPLSPVSPHSPIDAPRGNASVWEQVGMHRLPPVVIAGGAAGMIGVAGLSRPAKVAPGPRPGSGVFELEDTGVGRAV